MEYDFKNGKLILTIDPSKISHETEKSFVIASSHGFMPVGNVPSGRLKGRMLTVSLNVIVRK